MLARAMIALALLVGGGGLILFAVFVAAGPLPAVDWGFPGTGALLWDSFLCGCFFLQHSGMIRQSFRRRLARVVPSCYQPATYAIASGAALMAFVLLWQPSPAPGELFRLQGSARLAVRFLAIPGILIFVWGAQAQRSFDPFGLRAIRIRLQQEGEPAAGLVTHGPYRWVRHPLYLGMLLFIWSSPHLTPDRLLFNVLWSAWIWLGARWEEKDLVADFGETYRAYQRAVPMLIPWRRTAPWEGDRSQPPPR